MTAMIAGIVFSIPLPAEAFRAWEFREPLDTTITNLHGTSTAPNADRDIGQRGAAADPEGGGLVEGVAESLSKVERADAISDDGSEKGVEATGGGACVVASGTDRILAEGHAPPAPEPHPKSGGGARNVTAAREYDHESGIPSPSQMVGVAETTKSTRNEKPGMHAMNLEGDASNARTLLPPGWDGARPRSLAGEDRRLGAAPSVVEGTGWRALRRDTVKALVRQLGR